MRLRKMRTRSQTSEHQLHTDGYYVLAGACSVDANIVGQLRKLLVRKRAIFNGTKTPGATADRRRLQVNVGQGGGRAVQTFLRNVEKAISPAGAFEFNDWVVLQSLPGCQEQPPHTDFLPTPDLINATAHGQTSESLPLLCLVATMPNTFFDVWPQSIHLIQEESCSAGPRIKRTRLTLGTGDILVFRPDLIHAGAAFDEENIRLHAFIDKPNVRRIRNRTWIIHKNGSEKLKLRIAI